jgi:4-hydroxy-2-oxoheptanedioate aldolase
MKNIVSLKERLKSKDLLWMINAGGASIDVIDSLARAGAECVFIDCERTAINLESITPMVRAIHSHGMFAVLRSESLQAEVLIRYLDRGIDGLISPHVETAEQLMMISDVVDYVGKSQAREIFKIAQIESVPAVKNINDLANNQFTDAFLIGPNDLSHSLGLHGDQTNPLLWQSVDVVVSSLNQAQRSWGIPGNPQTCAKWENQGAGFLYCSVDQILKLGYSNFCK